MSSESSRRWAATRTFEPAKVGVEQARDELLEQGVHVEQERVGAPAAGREQVLHRQPTDEQPAERVRGPVPLVATRVFEAGDQAWIECGRIGRLTEQAVELGDPAPGLGAPAHAPCQAERQGEELVVRDVRLQLVEAAFELVDAPKPSPDLVVDPEATAQDTERLLAGDVVLDQAVPKDPLAGTREELGEQVDESTLNLDIELATRPEPPQGVEVARVLEHLDHAEVAADQLGNHPNLELLEADDADPGGRMQPDPPEQLLDAQPSVVVAEGLRQAGGRDR